VLASLAGRYVLAVKEKAVECVDVDSGVPVFVPILLKSEGGETEERTAPCLVNGERGGAGGNVEVWLNSGKYHQIQVSDGEMGGVIYVKRKKGSVEGSGGKGVFTQHEDLKSFKAFLCQVGGEGGGEEGGGGGGVVLAGMGNR
jgi:hypothetical protein